MRVILVSVLFALTAACSTSPVSVKDATSAPSNRSYLYQSPLTGSAVLLVVRDTGAVGSACNALVYIEGKVAAELEPGERARFYVPQGEHVIGTSTSGRGLCGASDRRERETVLKAGQTKAFRIFMSHGGEMDILPTTF